MFNINHLTIETLKGRILLKDFSFTLNPGDKIALIGEEGNGKSTLLKILAGINVDDYVRWSGNIYTNEKVVYMPQSLSAEELQTGVLDYIDGTDPDFGEIYSLAADLQIDPALLSNERRMVSLSGGEKVKIALLKLLYAKPDILLLDEPTNDLDLQTLIFLEEFIRQCRQSVLFISHDESLLENCSTGILHLEQLKRKSEARITFSGENYKEYSAHRRQWIDKTNQKAAKEKSELHKQLEKYRRIYQKVDHAQRTISRQDPHGGQLLKKKMHAVKALERNLETKKENMTKKFEPEEAIDIFFEPLRTNPQRIVLDHHWDQLKAGDRILSQDFDLIVKGRDKIVIIGSNGCGKSTLLREIAALLQESGLKTAYMPQNYEEMLDYSKTPVDHLSAFESRVKAGLMLGALKFTAEEMTHRIAALSQGQRCKLLIASLILQKAEVLLLDEPTRNLSPLSNPEVRKILQDYQGCIIAVSHDRAFIDEVAEKVFLLDPEGLHLLDDPAQ
ncbi:MAG: ABC-F family ATP-binding cassette domain-containing protein [Erysipelotrichaceae bacterium]|nr:ABC-F family ATP-binding cassette domain-containing protein [Erysipelotrichaceae bacterium]